MINIIITLLFICLNHTYYVSFYCYTVMTISISVNYVARYSTAAYLKKKKKILGFFNSKYIIGTLSDWGYNWHIFLNW